MQHSKSQPEPEDKAISDQETQQLALPLQSLTLDVDRYIHLQDDCDAPEEEQAAYMAALWGVMISFGDIGWGIDPTQAACGKLIKDTFERVAANDNQLESEDRKVAGGKSP